MVIGDILAISIIVLFGPCLLLLGFLSYKWAKKVQKEYEEHPVKIVKNLEEETNAQLYDQKAEFQFRMIIGSVFVLGGLGIVLDQIYTFLRYGFWQECSVITVLSNISDNIVEKLKSPSDWIGLAKILYYVFDFLPLSIILLIVGIRILTYESKNMH